MEREESAHPSLTLLSPLVGLWHFETLNSYPKHINLFHPPIRSQEVLQRDNNNSNHQLHVCSNNPLEVQVTMILFKAPTETESVPNPFSKSNNFIVKLNNFHNTQQIQCTHMDCNGTSTLMHPNREVI
jgi:hypothetical protein